MAIANTARSDGRLTFDVAVTNRTGHKLPTAYPARRAWLHVTVRDASNAVVFESGAVRPDGSIVGGDNDADPQKFEQPHYSRITQPDQVEIFESIMGDFRGRVTTGLLYGSHYLKDNRILPKGFDKKNADPQIAVVGPARDDPRFIGGSAAITYSVAAPRITLRAPTGYRPSFCTNPSAIAGPTIWSRIRLSNPSASWAITLRRPPTWPSRSPTQAPPCAGRGYPRSIRAGPDRA
ncbi:MAG: hypothetical protein U1E93_03785 [Alphaproteobacteria bacterium]